MMLYAGRKDRAMGIYYKFWKSSLKLSPPIGMGNLEVVVALRL